LAFAAPIQVAVIDGGNPSGSYADVKAQLDDSVSFDFKVVLVAASSVKTAADLSAYDVVVVGSSGSSDPAIYNSTFGDAVTAFHGAGGAIVAHTWLSYESDAAFTRGYLPIDQNTRSRAYCNGPSSFRVTVTTEVTDGVPDFTDASSYMETPGPALPGAQVVATACGGQPAVTQRDSSGSRGRQVYLGALYSGIPSSYNNTGLRSGAPDQLLEQAVHWAAGGCEDQDKDGVSACRRDCDDLDPDRFPGNPEVCDGVDNDCDDALPPSELDADGDTFLACEECDDTQAANYPGNAEVCDGADNDCDGSPDNGLTFADWWPDVDGDTFGDASASPVSACADLAEHARNADDCDDGNADISPNATDVPGNGIDEDCSGADTPAVDQDPGGGEEAGCGCATSPGAAWTALLLLPAVLLRRRRS
jgi:MYXO-CTERM domain-containing protein